MPQPPTTSCRSFANNDLLPLRNGIAGRCSNSYLVWKHITELYERRVNGA